MVKTNDSAEALKTAISEIDPKADVKDKNTKDLQATLSALKFDQAAQKSKVKAEAEKALETPPYTVIMGKALTTRRGIRFDGQDVVATDFNKDEKLGQVILDGWVNKGFVDKN